MATTDADAEWEEPKPRITEETLDNGEEPNAKKNKYKLSEKKRRTFRRTGVLLFRVCCLSFLIVLYVIFGALVLHFVERPAEETRVVEAERINATVRAWLLEVLENHTLLESNATSRSAFVEQIVANVSVATVLGAFEVRSSSNWDFGQSLFFAVTVITTIGYGNVLIRTDSGRVFIVFFAFFGIPLSILLIATLGQLLSRLFKFILKPFRKKLVVLLLGYASLLLIGFMVIILLPSIVFWLVETGSGAPDVGPSTINQIPFSSLSSALYYSFITLSTIGFGDIVVLTSDTHPDTPAGTACYVAFIVVWVYVGLAYLGLVIHEIIIGFTAVWKRIVVKVPWCGMEVAEERFEDSALERLIAKIRTMPGRMRGWTKKEDTTEQSDVAMTAFTIRD